MCECVRFCLLMCLIKVEMHNRSPSLPVFLIHSRPVRSRARVCVCACAYIFINRQICVFKLVYHYVSTFVMYTVEYQNKIKISIYRCLVGGAAADAAVANVVFINKNFHFCTSVQHTYLQCEY